MWERLIQAIIITFLLHLIFGISSRSDVSAPISTSVQNDINPIARTLTISVK